jgi:predicted RNA-binding protein with RPS1 domain
VAFRYVVPDADGGEAARLRRGGISPSCAKPRINVNDSHAPEQHQPAAPAEDAAPAPPEHAAAFGEEAVPAAPDETVPHVPALAASAVAEQPAAPGRAEEPLAHAPPAAEQPQAETQAEAATQPQLAGRPPAAEQPQASEAPPAAEPPHAAAEPAPVAEAPPVAEPPHAAEQPALEAPPSPPPQQPVVEAEAAGQAFQPPAEPAGAPAAQPANAPEVPAPQADAAGEGAPQATTAEPLPAEQPAAAAAQADDGAIITSEPSVTPPAPPAAPAPPDPRVEERKRRAQAAWERVVNARENGEVLTGTVTAVVKGGLLVDVGGIRGFLPASQVRVPQGTAIDTLLKTKIPLKVIDIDQSRRRIVVSHRRAAEEERRAKRGEVLKSLAVGQVREGIVVRLTDFGAFVDLGGIDGLIPMRELAFERVEKTSDVVSVGEKLPVEVLRIEEGGKKISLSRKNALPDPWRDHADVLRHGKTIEGKVVGKEPRLQVEIAPGIVGTVRESDADPAQYEIGEAIEVTVRRADRATRRITLSTMNAATAMPPPSNSGGFAPLGVELGRR